MSIRMKEIAVKILWPIYEQVWIQNVIGRGVARVQFDAFGAAHESDISDHLHILNLFLSTTQPKVLVELGTRGGESTKVFSRYAADKDCDGFSVDLSSHPEWLKEYPNWKHFISDDCALGEKIKLDNSWPDGTAFNKIDLLFIDTSHEYKHTLRELEVWLPLLNQGGWVLFHDTNLSSKPTRRLSGRVNYGWDNSRGVTKAIEEFFGFVMHENEFYSSQIHGVGEFIFHLPWNNGFTAIKVK
jgi:cephalosporin hydroxylase